MGLYQIHNHDQVLQRDVIKDADVRLTLPSQFDNLRMLLMCLVLTYDVVSAVEELEDFPGCGLRNAPSLSERGDDECLWDCTWVTNPFYRKSWNIRLVDQHLRDPNQANQKVVFKDVRYIMTTPRIPRDLSCLANCRLPEVVI